MGQKKLCELKSFSKRGDIMAKKTAHKRKNIKGQWTQEDLKLLKKLFANTATAEVATELGRRTDAVKKKASRMGMHKTRRYMKSLGRA